MELARAEMMAKDLIAYYLGNEWRFGWDRAKNRHGVCFERRRLIQLSGPITAHGTEDEVLDTILHEIAHGLTPNDGGHGRIWRDMAVSLGCNGERTAAKVAAIEGRWKATCSNCGTVYTAHRLAKDPWTGGYRRRSCPKPTCGNGKFDVRFLLKFELR